MLLEMMQLLLLQSLIPPATSETVDVIDYQKQAIENLLTIGNPSECKGRYNILCVA